MSHKYRLFFTFIFLIGFLFASAEEVTLQSSVGHRVTVYYDLIIDNDNVSIRFNNVNVEKSLEAGHEKKDIKVLFFEKNGGFGEDKFLSDIEPEILRVSSDKMEYQSSQEGYVILNESPELRLKLLVQKAQLSIPIYLAYYEKKHTYKVFANCKSLVIPLAQKQKPPHPVQPQDNPGKNAPTYETRTRTITIPEEIEVPGELSDSETALLFVARVENLLEQCSGTELPDGLASDIEKLRGYQLTIQDEKVRQSINEVLQRYAQIQNDIRDNASSMATQEKEKALVDDVQDKLNYLKDRLDNIDNLSDSDVARLKEEAAELRKQSFAVKDKELANQMTEMANRCDEEVKKIEDAKKRQNIWMIIGGILLAILMFVGNQMFQHFRNIRNQKSIEDMQNKMVRRAEDDAKRRAHNMVRSNVNRVQNAARQKGTDVVRKGIKDPIQKTTKGKGKKTFDV